MRTKDRAANSEPAGQTVIPVVHEQLKVGKRLRETGTTRIRKIVRHTEEVVDEPLLQDEVKVEHIPINRHVPGPVAVREENGTTIVPVLEEVLVVEKRLLLKEELRITKQSRTVHKPQRVMLRKEEAVVERIATQEKRK